jgi:hypothetical protein
MEGKKKMRDFNLRHEKLKRVSLSVNGYGFCRSPHAIIFFFFFSSSPNNNANGYPPQRHYHAY